MDTLELMAKFADPQTIQALSLTQRLTAGLITTVLGIGITFLSLIILQFVISLMARFSAVKAPAARDLSPQPRQTAASAAPVVKDQRQEDEQLVAAITVALAVQLGTAAGNIIIRNIRKVEDHSPAWNKAGLAELMNNNS
jgi:sodium pump decarboxylase gamma subunit